MERNEYFCGWYFKCQAGKDSIALIPAVHRSGGRESCSIQFISFDSNHSVTLPAAQSLVMRDRPWASFGENRFSGDGIELSLHSGAFSAEGSLRFGPPASIRYDIMGPFRHVPFMECRHSVFSMRHQVSGSLVVNGRLYRFDNDWGYIEGDRGRSFPKHYIWTQCCFAGGSLMLAVADIPLGPVRFTGITGVILLCGREYRIATYMGARVAEAGLGRVVICQGPLRFTAELLEQSPRPLRAPVNGAMSRTIHENLVCRARYRLEKRGMTLLDMESGSASFEFEYP